MFTNRAIGQMKILITRIVEYRVQSSSKVKFIKLLWCRSRVKKRDVELKC